MEVYSFSFEISELLKRINREVLYKTRNRDEKRGTGNNSTVDADPVIKDYLETISSELFSEWTSPLARGLSVLEDPQLPYEFDTSGNIVYRMQFPATFDKNSTTSIDRSLKNSMVSYCVYQWLMDANIQGWEKYEQEHLREKNKLRSLLVRRTSMTRDFRLL